MKGSCRVFARIRGGGDADALGDTLQLLDNPDTSGESIALVTPELDRHGASSASGNAHLHQV